MNPWTKNSTNIAAFLAVVCIVVSGMPLVQGVEDEEENLWNEGLVVQPVWDSAPFNVIFTLCEWNGYLYAGGRYNERIYKSSNGVTWTPAFSAKTSYAWDASIVYDGSMYFASSETESDEWFVKVWRTTDGNTLTKVFESEHYTEKVMSARKFNIYNDTIAIGLKRTGAMIRSRDGTNWEKVQISSAYSSLNHIIEFKEMYYLTGASTNNGGALFRSSDCNEWDLIQTWKDGTIDHHSGAGSMVIFNEWLYICNNGNKITTWGVVLKTEDGENFTEVWHGTEDHINGPNLIVFDDRLFLTVSGISSRTLGGEILVLNETKEDSAGSFVRILDGFDSIEHHFHGRAVFKGSLFIGGGSGKWEGNNAILYKITNRADEDPSIEVAEEDLPFGTVFVLTEFNGYMYTAGRWYEKVYRSTDGEHWERAFPQKTTYSWQNGITFENSLYLVSCEGEGDRRTTILWRSEDGKTLQSVFELKDTTTERPALGIYNGSLYMGVEQYVNDELTGCLYRSDLGADWEMIFSTDMCYRFQEFRTFQGAFYFTMSGVNCGGVLLRSYDGSSFEVAARWNDSIDYGDNGAIGLSVYKEELYVTLNHDGESKYVRLMKSSDGCNFTEVWFTTVKGMNAARVCVYDGRLFLYICGKMDNNLGYEIWYDDGSGFVLMYRGRSGTEHTILRHVIFKNEMYMGGGSGNWKSHDAMIHRIGYFIPERMEPEENDLSAFFLIFSVISINIIIVIALLLFFLKPELFHIKPKSRQPSSTPEPVTQSARESADTKSDFPSFDSASSGIQREIIDVLTPIPNMDKAEIARMLGHDVKTVSLQLSILMRKQLIRMEKIGKKSVYSVIKSPGDPDGQPISDDESSFSPRLPPPPPSYEPPAYDDEAHY